MWVRLEVSSADAEYNQQGELKCSGHFAPNDLIVTYARFEIQTPDD
jgi:hypothetical protein